MYTVDIDIGGTLTDGLVGDGQKVTAFKVDTTPHDFTVCFFDCLREAATALGFTELESFLEKVSVIRWSSTISTNVLAEKKGPRIGLLGSEDLDTKLYGAHASPAVGMILDEDAMVAVSEPLEREAVLAQIRRLLDHGVRRICISFAGAYADPSGEWAVKRWVAEQYPDHFLGAVPALAGTDMALHPDDQTRTHLALINAYVHTPLAVSLFKAEEELLHIYGYRRPLYIGHVSGGVARVAKTKGFDTLESGPVFGANAAAWFAARYRDEKVLAVDVGGTTAKLAVIRGGRPEVSPESEIFGVPLRMPWILLRSVALGGGSVARVESGEVRLGPESMGAYPGPACYNLGGEMATLTDAFVVAGLLDPERFLGGRRALDRAAAEAAIREQIAGPLGIVPLEAATAVIEAAAGMLEVAARSALAEAGDSADGLTVYGFGGNGALLAAALAERLGVGDATVFGLGHVFSAFGSSVSDICHVQEEFPAMDLNGGADAARLAAQLDAARERVLHDLDGEGVTRAEAELGGELLVVDGARNVTVPVPVSDEAATGAEDLLALARAAAAELAGEGDAGGARIERLIVRGVLGVPHYRPEPVGASGDPAVPARQRDVAWSGGAAGPAYVFDWDGLGPGSSVDGPAVLEAGSNTCALPPGWRMEIDGYRNVRMSQSAGAGR